jgi:predicted TIM-barrel fold metal-dependent hydrolase
MDLRRPYDRADQLPPLVSVDDHVIEPPDVWQERLPRRLRDRGPRVERRRAGRLEVVAGGYRTTPDPSGGWADWWCYEDVLVPHRRVTAAAGTPLDRLTLDAITYDEMRAGCYDPAARLADMDVDHVEASLCFPTFPRFCGQTFLDARDKDLALRCVRAYNDWMVEAWAGGSGGRLVPLVLVPLWDAALAAAEVVRNAERGVRAVAFSELPASLGLPSVHDADRWWEPFFRACAETGTVVCMHVGTSTRGTIGTGGQVPATSADAPAVVGPVLLFGNVAASLTDLLFSGVLVRHPELRVAYSEGQIGWIPYVLERCDDVWHQHRGWTGIQGAIPEPPSHYYRRQVYGCFFRDQHGIDSLDAVGAGNITFETDYPHAETPWPRSREVLWSMVGHLPAPVVDAIARGNACRMLGRDEAPPDAPGRAT